MKTTESGYLLSPKGRGDSLLSKEVLEQRIRHPYKTTKEKRKNP